MPVPASEAIASDVGHGALGARSGLRPFRDLLSETVGQRHLWVELRPKKLLTTWIAEGGGVFRKAVAEVFDGVVLDVVGVQTLTETLVRVESQALLTAGHFYYSGATLYVYLTGGVAPSTTSVVVQLGVHVGSHGVYQPVLGVDRLANGPFEAWTDPGGGIPWTPDGWTVSSSVSAGTIGLDKTTSDPLQGNYAARISFTAATGAIGVRQDFTTLVAGQVYRFSGAYRVTSTAGGLMASVYIDDAGTGFVLPDGRTIGTSTRAWSDVAGAGEWRRFAFDFVCPAWGTLRASLFAETVSGTQSGLVDWDDVRLQPVYRYAYHEPLLSIDSVPILEAARADAFWGEMSSALGSLSLLNGGGRLEPLLAAYDWIGADAICRVGGRFQLGGNEILLDDCPVIASGRLGAPTVTDSGVAFDLEDDRKLGERILPTRTYSDSGTPALVQSDFGRSRALLFGTKRAIKPVQYGTHTTGGGAIPLGSYEVVDCTDWAAGIKEFTSVSWYTDEDAATARAASRRTVGPYGSDFDFFVATGRFDVLLDMHPLVITQENNKLHFDTGGAVLSAEISPQTSHMHKVAYDLYTAMRALDGADVTVGYDVSGQLMHISKTAGTLNLRCATGADAQMGVWALLGFSAAADRTGSLNYAADTTIQMEAYDAVLRIDAIGFKDDASGTYTGTASATIEKAPDIARFILRVLLGVPASAIDLPSFVAARAVADRPCSLYVGNPRTVADIFSELETTGNMDLMLKGGVWYCQARDATTPVGTPELVDTDFLSFESHYDPEDLFKTVSLTYNESPDGSNAYGGGLHRRGPNPSPSPVKMGEVEDETIALRYGRFDQKTFATCLRDAADATTPLAGSRLEEIATQASTKRRRFTFSTKGKALQVPVGGKLLLTRSRGLDATGALSAVLVRVLRKRDDWGRWVSDVVAIEVV